MVEREIPEHAQTILMPSELKMLKDATGEASTKEALRIAVLDYNKRYIKGMKKQAKEEIEEMKGDL